MVTFTIGGQPVKFLVDTEAYSFDITWLPGPLTNQTTQKTMSAQSVQKKRNKFLQFQTILVAF